MTRRTRPVATEWYLTDLVEEGALRPHGSKSTASQAALYNDGAKGAESCASTDCPGKRNSRRAVRPRRPVLPYADDEDTVFVPVTSWSQLDRAAKVVGEQRAQRQAEESLSHVMSRVAFATVLLILCLCWYRRKDGSDVMPKRDEDRKKTDGSSDARKNLSRDSVAAPSPSKRKKRRKKKKTKGKECGGESASSDVTGLSGRVPVLHKGAVPPPLMPNLSSDIVNEDITLEQAAMSQARTAARGDCNVVNVGSLSDAADAGDVEQQTAPLSSDFHVVEYSEITSETVAKLTVECDTVPSVPATPNAQSRLMFATPPRTCASATVAVAGAQSCPSAVIHAVSSTPRTPLEYTNTVEAIASIVSSTGLDRQASLQVANDHVMRRLENEMAQLSIQEKEAKKEKLEEKRREEEKQEANRRHEESLRAMRKEPNWEDTLNEAREKCWKLAWRIFPCGHFLFCTCVALAVMFVRQNSSTIRRLLQEVEASNPIAFVLEVIKVIVSEICGCACVDDEMNENEAFQPSQTFYSYIPWLVWTLPSELFSSSVCIIPCLVTFAIYFVVISAVHRVMQWLKCHEFLHQGLNLLVLLSAVMTSLVQQSPLHEGWQGLLFDLVLPVASVNSFFAAVFGTIWYRLKTFSAAGKENKAKISESVELCKQQISLLSALEMPSSAISFCVAVVAGFYWGQSKE